MTVELVKSPFWYLFNPVNYVQEGWCVRLGQEEIMWGWGNCLKYLNRGGTEKKQGETKILKKRKAGSRGQCLKRGAATPLEIMKIILPAYIKKHLRATLVAQVLSKTSVKKKKKISGVIEETDVPKESCVYYHQLPPSCTWMRWSLEAPSITIKRF